MKKMLNESHMLDGDAVLIRISDLKHDDPSIDGNELRDLYLDKGAEVDGIKDVVAGKNVTYMSVKGLDYDEVMNTLADYTFMDINELETYIINDDPEEKELPYPAYDDVDVNEDEDDIELTYPAYDDVRIDLDSDDEELYEKRRGCCPKGTKTVNESASESDVAAVLEDIENSALRDKTIAALNEGRHSLHTNVRINGKTFAQMTLKELTNWFDKVTESKNALTAQLNGSLNESANAELNKKLESKNQLLEFIDQEITYRKTRLECLHALNEDDYVMSDEEIANMFGPAQGEEEKPAEEETKEDGEEKSEETKEDDEEKSEETKEESEEVELSRVEITLKDMDAVNDLKQACLDAGIPEDAFEVEGKEEEATEEDDEESDEEEEEAPAEETEETEEEPANESYEYANIVKLLYEGEVPAEGEDVEEAPAEDEETEPAEEPAEDAESEESEEEEETCKFILTNTDYAADLAKVLDDVYGISKEEFEEMIGGEIVDNSSEEGEEKSEETEETTEEEPKEDETDLSDLFKGL